MGSARDRRAFAWATYRKGVWRERRYAKPLDFKHIINSDRYYWISQRQTETEAHLGRVSTRFHRSFRNWQPYLLATLIHLHFDLVQHDTFLLRGKEFPGIGYIRIPYASGTTATCSRRGSLSLPSFCARSIRAFLILTSRRSGMPSNVMGDAIVDNVSAHCA